MATRFETIREAAGESESAGTRRQPRSAREQAADAKRAQAAVSRAEAERRRARSRSSIRRPRYEAAHYKAAGKLEGKCALITGGDSGIGRAVAVLYAREGADVAIIYLPRGAERRRRNAQRGGSRGPPLRAAPGRPRRTRSSADRSSSRPSNELGKLDILVSNAAHQNRKKSLDELTDEELETTFEINILAYIRLCRAALEHMKRGRGDHRHELGDRHHGLGAASRLLGDQRRDQRVHEDARAER